MSRNWTPAQQDAITATGGSVLVSAAAGSGKTAVLVERVIRLITRSEKPVDVDRLLIVTFTRAAAAEMKQRLTDEITKLLEDDPYNPLLLRQKQLMYNTSICTIDSFCSSVVREYFHTLGVSGDFRLADEGELKILSEEALTMALEEFYNKGTAEFLSLVDAFASKKGDDNLRKAVLKIESFLSTQPFGEKWLDDMLKNYDPEKPIEQAVCGKIIIDYAKSSVEHAILVTKNSIEKLNDYECDEKLSKALLPKITDDLYFLEKLLNRVENGSWDEIAQFVVKFSPATLSAPRGYKDDPVKLSIAAARDEVKSTVKSLSSCFMWSSELAKAEISYLNIIVSQLFLVVLKYIENFSDLKQKKNILSFADVELLTVKLLATPTEDSYEKTEQAREISQRFDWVMVDEFQDVNDVQDLIFKCVSTDENNMFVVGDVKQSIYGFRQAKPEIFINRRKSYKRFDRENADYPATIILDKNFRSREDVCSAVNFIFKNLMSLTSAKMEYNTDEYLNTGASYEPSDSCRFELDLLDREDTGDESVVNEAKFIEHKIHSMMKSGFTVRDGNGTRPATYGDFAVILRSTKGTAAEYVNTLINCGVPAYSEIKESFFDADEIKIMLNFLRVIDNPSLDIPLLSVMCSPVYGFTVDELAKIRGKNRYTNLYSAVSAYAENDKKSTDFLAELSSIRTYSYTCTIDELLGRVYELTSFMPIISAISNGASAVKNLNLLREYARGFESNGYKGLNAFVSYMDKLIENGSDLVSSSKTDGDYINMVRVLSIHASKGLEFPVCFIANTSKRFNKTDLNEDVLIDSNAGLGIKHIDGFCRYNTLPRLAVSIEISDNEIAEELRVLYVALTRAKEKLIVVSSQKNPVAYLTKLSSKIVGGVIDPYTVMRASSISDWISLCALIYPTLSPLRAKVGMSSEGCISETKMPEWDVLFPQNSDFNSERENTSTVDSELSVKIPEYSEKILELMKKRIGFAYPNQAVLNIPQKVSASEISHQSGNEEFAKVFLKPSFMNTEISTAVERGTAHHRFLQYCNFASAKESVEAEMERLVADLRLTKEQADAIDVNALSSFMHSELVSRIIASKNVMREERFTVKINASLVDDSLDGKAAETKVVMQGAVDLLFEENGKLVLVDYKTDRVREVERLRTLYSKQLELYKNAVEQSTEMQVSTCIIYSIHRNEFVNV